MSKPRTCQRRKPRCTKVRKAHFASLRTQATPLAEKVAVGGGKLGMHADDVAVAREAVEDLDKFDAALARFHVPIPKARSACGADEQGQYV